MDGGTLTLTAVIIEEVRFSAGFNEVLPWDKKTQANLRDLFRGDLVASIKGTTVDTHKKWLVSGSHWSSHHFVTLNFNGRTFVARATLLVRSIKGRNSGFSCTAVFVDICAG